MNVHPKFVFLLIPIRSTVNLLQLFRHAVSIRRKFGKINVFFSVNGFTSFGGILLKKLGLVKKTVFWVWDYYPIKHRSLTITIMRWFYWQFDKFASKSDMVVCLNKTMHTARRESGLKENHAPVFVPIGTDKGRKNSIKNIKKIRLGFIGVVKKSQGLDLIFDSADLLQKNFPGIVLEIIGSGPDIAYFRKRAKNSAIRVVFHGFVDESEIGKILPKCTIGIAPYIPDESNVSFFGDPGKVKRYLGFDMPAIITNVFEFSKELEKNNAGVIIDYYNHKQLVAAIRRIMKNYTRYSDNALILNQKFYYRDIYPKMFEFEGK